MISTKNILTPFPTPNDPIHHIRQLLFINLYLIIERGKNISDE